MTAYRPWTPKPVHQDFDIRMENAFRRVSGSIGYDISFDHGRSKMMRETTRQALETALESPGPLFMKAGSALLETGGFRPGAGVPLKEVAGEILYEFFTEGTAAFQAAKAALYADALAHLRGLGEDGEPAAAVLAAASETFRLPDKEEFSKAALPFVTQKLAPAGSAALAGLGTLALTVALARSPHLGVAAGLVAASLAFYFSRKRQTRAAGYMVAHLPRTLYDLLDRTLQHNTDSFAATINNAMKLMKGVDDREEGEDKNRENVC